MIFGYYDIALHIIADENENEYITAMHRDDDIDKETGGLRLGDSGF